MNPQPFSFSLRLEDFDLSRLPISADVLRADRDLLVGRLHDLYGEVAYVSKQQAWDEFWLRNRMKLRLKGLLRELLIYGEVFNRFFRTKDGLVVRQLDPATIWDIYTDPEDLERVHFYHQQYVILQNLNIPGGVPGAPPSTLIIRQIPGAEIDHFKINSTSSEKRGRSQLFAILGYLQRFREFANDRVLLNKMRAMFALDVSVEGTQEDLSAAESQFSTPPGTGSVLVHNAGVKVYWTETGAGATPVTGFEAERYLGTWHEIARLDHSFERGLTNVTAEYGARPDGGISVLNRGYDPKAGQKIIDVADAAGATDRLWLCSSNRMLLERLGRRAPSAQLVHSVRRRRLDVPPERHAAVLAESGIHVVNMHRTDWSGGLVALYRRFGIQVFAWDVQEVRHFREVLALDVDAVYSDHVDRMVGVVAEWQL
jgi:hypothetical protein